MRTHDLAKALTEFIHIYIILIRARINVLAKVYH